MDTKDWVTGTWLGNGLQGGIYQNDEEVICAFKGTAMGRPPGQTIVADLTADLRLALGIIPNQAGGAYALVKTAQEIAKGRVVTATGHSLGGALAQVVGKWCNVPFVTFNAPA
jgi:putative lipase involved disintegration of autophagic bodies